ncbi:MAG: hypothetical protein A2463_03175, partial [Candidatus Staskawiczbacteria bacterium RIFOXYC2_FULL_32_10]
MFGIFLNKVAYKIKRFSFAVLRFSFKNTPRAILVTLILTGIFCSAIYVFAIPPTTKYDIGEEDNPNCSYGDPNCDVVAPAQYSFGTNNFSGTGAIEAGAITGTSFTIGANTISNFANLDNLADLSYVSTSFVKMTEAGTFALDTNTYLTSETSHTDVLQDGDFASQGIMLRGASSGTYSILTDNSTNWNTAYGWGDHGGLYSLTSHNHSGVYEPVISAGTTGQYYRGDKSWQTLDKTAVGLGSVENTALSTWAGTSNITTVGALTSGSISTGFTAIDDSFISSAVTWNAKQTGHANLTSLAGLTYSSGTPFVKMTEAGTFALDTNTYLTSETSHTDVLQDGDFASQGIMLRGASSGTYSILTDNSTNWNTAYGWGDHAGLYTPIAHQTTENAINGLVFVDGVGNYSAKTIGTDVQAYDAELLGLAGLTYASGTPFVKMTEAGTFALDTSTYSTQTLSLGTTTQIPFMNVGGTDFLYSAGLTYDDTNKAVNVNAMRAIAVNGATGSENLFLGQSGNFTTTGTNNIFAGYQAGLASVADVDNIAIGYKALTANTYARKNVAIGTQALYTQSYTNFTAPWDTANVAIGYQALYSNQPTQSGDGKENVAIGYQSMKTNTEGKWNTALGTQSLYSNSTTAYNTAIGYQSLYANTGIANTALGYRSLYQNEGGGGNTAGGYGALYGNIAGDNNTTFGYYAGYADKVSDNTFIGYNSGQANTYGAKNVALGSGALYTQSYANGNSAWDTANVAVGYNALYSNQPNAANNGYRNTAVGYRALKTNSTGLQNSSVGFESLYLNTTGQQNTALGNEALRANTTASYNTSIGSYALNSNTTGSYNVAVGSSALTSNIAGQYNIGVGNSALNANTYASGNVAIGYSALQTQSYANGNVAWNTANVALGYQALYKNQPTSSTDGYLNTALGSYAGYNGTTGASNIFLGYKSGYNQTTNSNLLIIDNQDRTSAALEATNSLVYGSFNATVASQALAFNAGSVSFGSDTAGGATNVPGSIKLFSNGDNAFYTTFTAGTQTANATYTLPTAMPASNKFLQSTDAGVLSWETPGGSSMAIGGAITSGTSGSVLYVDSSNQLAQDNANFFWDDSNKWLGIGTASPINPLDVYSNSAYPVLSARTESDTTYPILGAYRSRSSLGAVQANDILGRIDFVGRGPTGLWHGGQASIYGYAGSTWADPDFSTYLTFVTRNTTGSAEERVRISKEGYVGIGTIDPNAKLDVLTTSGAQARLSYDTSNYSNFTVGSTGDLTIATTGTGSGDIIFDPAGAGSPSLLSGSGIVILGGTGNTNNEDLSFDFETTANTVALASLTGVTVIKISDVDLGDGSAGMVLALGRNSNGTNTGAGSINFLQKGGTAGYVWQDAAGKMRINTSAPTNANDTAGTVIGDQSSSRETKQDIAEFTDYASALKMITDSPLYNFRYKNEVMGYGSDSPLAKTRLGFIAEDSPEIFMWGKSIDQVSINGVLMASIKELNNLVMAPDGSVGDGSIEGIDLSNPFVLRIKNILAALGIKFGDNGEVKVQKLCIGNTCVDENQLKDLLNNNGNNAPTVVAPPAQEPPAEQPPAQEPPA